MSSISTPPSPRRPALILVDELAHSNAPGLPLIQSAGRMWMNFAGGRDRCFHLPLTSSIWESLNDVVSGITGVQVRETVPDPFFDAADDVVLVDLP